MNKGRIENLKSTGVHDGMGVEGWKGGWSGLKFVIELNHLLIY